MTEKLTAGQEVRVHAPHGSMAGTVSKVGRQWALIKYGSRMAEFNMETRRKRGLQVGTGYYYEVIDPDREQERWSAAVDALEAEGIRLDPRHELSLEQLEAMAAIAHDDKPEDGA